MTNEIKKIQQKNKQKTQQKTNNTLNILCACTLCVLGLLNMFTTRLGPIYTAQLTHRRHLRPQQSDWSDNRTDS